MSRTPNEPIKEPIKTARDLRSNRATVIDALRRPMAERLELALNWDKLASELRAGMHKTVRPRDASR